MQRPSISIGSRVKHPTYGEGLILDNSMESSYHIVFKHHGEKAIGKDFDGLELIELAPLPEQRVSLGDIEAVIGSMLRKWAGVTETVPMGSRWKGGKLILQPGDPDKPSREIPIETFFHKIVMVRDRLRVLEQNVNKSSNLSDEEKVNIQQYITRVYGSLTTFNILFAAKEDHFKGESKRK
ncbi:MAG: hypothetical protein AAGI38_10135 [Bacteroidota bacterium]